MRKIRPKAILSRVLLGESRQKDDGLDYLYTGFEYDLLGSDLHVYIGRATADDADGDGSTICSYSTTATADNLPGADRSIDTLMFQPMGRRIERLAMRFTIASVHPGRIAQYIEADDTGLYPVFDGSKTLHDAIAKLCSERRNGSTVVAGMKGLMKQTQPKSIHTSASALAVLIRVSLGYMREEVYANISRIEPIFHLEVLAGPLVPSHPDRKWFLLLAKLARETLIAIRRPLHQFSFDPGPGKQVCWIRPSPETAQKLRQKLIRALKVYRLSGFDSLDDTMREACRFDMDLLMVDIAFRSLV